MSAKFSLRWNDFQDKVSQNFSLLRSEEEFFDVSMVSDDQKMMLAHKLVLSASSPYFKHILTNNKHSHPLLCLDGVSSGELQFVLDYIYHGEVQIHEEQLDRFLEVAKKLKLEGLTNEDGEHGKEANETLEEAVAIEIETEEEEIVIRKAATNTKEIDQKISKYIVRGEDRKYSCGFCGKSGVKLAGDIKRHIETHLDDLSFPCQSCEKTFKSRDTLRKHKNKYHRS